MEHREFRGLWKNVRVSLRYRRRLLKRLCRIYDLPPIPLRSKSNPGFSGLYRYDDPPGKRIEVCPKYGRDLLILAHEFAHYVTHMRQPNATDHGPVFLRNYMLVCGTLRLIPPEGFRAACRKYDLRIAASP